MERTTWQQALLSCVDAATQRRLEPVLDADSPDAVQAAFTHWMDRYRAAELARPCDAVVGAHEFGGHLRPLIRDARRQALRAVDSVQVRACWEVGRHIVEFEQGGADSAEYGARLLPRLAARLTAEFGRGFDASNLRYMRLF